MRPAIPSHDQVRELIPAFALGCLDPEDARMVKEHLGTCGACRGELANYEVITGRLAVAVSPIAPPPSLRERLLRRLPPEPNRQELPRRGLSKRGFPGLFGSRQLRWAAVALPLLIAVTVGILMVRQQLVGLRDQGPRTVQSVVPLAATPAAPGARGLLFVFDDGRTGSLVVEGLPDLGSDRQYQLWLIRDGKRTSAGVFSVTLDGYNMVRFSAPLPISTYSAFGVSVEPHGGSPSPTGSKVLGSPA